MSRWAYLLVAALITSLVMLWIVTAGISSKPEQTEPVELSYLTSGQSLALADVYEFGAERWQSIDAETTSFGYTDKEYWLRFYVQKAPVDRILSIGYPLLDQLDVYWVTGEGTLTYELGDKQPFYQRPIFTSEYSVPLAKNTEGMVYLRAKTTSSMRLPISIFSQHGFFDYELQKRLIEGLYFGVLLCMAVYNLFGFVASKEPEFGLYSLYTLCFAGLMLSLDGLGFRYLWPDSLFLQDKGIPIFGSLTLLIATLFAYQLLRLKDYRQTLAVGLYIMAGASVITLLLGIFADYQISIQAILILAAPSCFYLLLVGVYLWRKGFVYARMFTIAWGALLLSVIANSLGYLGIIDSVFIQRHAIMLGSSIEILLLSWVLAVRYNEQRQEKLSAQQRYNDELEDNVAERTLELQFALRELQDANSELEQRNFEDSLTGLNNHRYFTQQLEKEYRRAYRNDAKLSLLMIDIDHFKQINDTHGHFIGDQVLMEMAKLLKQSARRPADTVCRYGGEEFGIILPDTDAVQAKVVADKLVETVRSTALTTDSGPLNITISVGVADINVSQSQSSKQLFKAADEALYQAKRDGRDQVVTMQL